MAYEKLYNEIYAVVVLRYFWAEYKPGFVKSESPDWMNRTMDFGMEVSQALLPYDGQSESFLEYYLGKRQEEIPEAAQEKYAGKLYFYNGRLWALLNGEEDPASYVEKVQFRFECKLKKLNSNYTRCGCNALYLYVHAQPETVSDVAAIMQKMKEIQDRETYRFQKVFLDCESCVYILDFEQETLESIRIPEKARLFLEGKTEKLRNQEEWSNEADFEAALSMFTTTSESPATLK